MKRDKTKNAPNVTATTVKELKRKLAEYTHDTRQAEIETEKIRDQMTNYERRHAADTTRINELRREIAELSSKLARTLGYIDRVNEDKRKPIIRQVEDLPPSSGPVLEYDFTPPRYSSSDRKKEWWEA